MIKPWYVGNIPYGHSHKKSNVSPRQFLETINILIAQIALN